MPVWLAVLAWVSSFFGEPGARYACKRCAMNEFQAKAARCYRSPCPMELV